MNNRELMFLILLSLGIFTLLSAIMLARMNWRPDLPPFGRRTSLIDLMLHPERYVTSQVIGRVRWLNRLGVLFLACALGILANEAFRDFLGR